MIKCLVGLQAAVVKSLQGENTAAGWQMCMVLCWVWGSFLFERTYILKVMIFCDISISFFLLVVVQLTN